MNFNAPPTWPQPPAGWTPPPGWSPDPAWGPAPEGWQFWVDDAESAEPGPVETDPTTQPIDTGALGPETEENSAAGHRARRTGPVLAAAWARMAAPFTRESSADGAEPSGEQRRKGKTTRVAVAVAAVALFGGGIGTGVAVADPTTSEEYATLASAKADVEDDYQGLRDDHATLQSDYDEMSSGLEDREAELQERADAVKASEEDLKEREDGVKKAEEAVQKREDAVSGAEQKKAENTIREGTWTVGVDITPGTYRTTDTVGSRCYWGIYATGSNGDDIISNGIPGGGRPSVTLSEGQDFETSTCGTWQLQ